MTPLGIITRDGYDKLEAVAQALLDSVYDLKLALEVRHLHPEGIARAKVVIAQAEKLGLR